jgi:hypothetical protein
MAFGDSHSLEGERERPAAFADCRELLAQVIEDEW